MQGARLRQLAGVGRLSSVLAWDLCLVLCVFLTRVLAHVVRNDEMNALWAKSTWQRRWQRWRFVASLVLALAALDALIHAGRGTWRRYDPDDYRDHVRACRDGAWDLVLVGGSTVHEGVDGERLAGLSWQGRPLTRVFNCGLEGATTSEVWHAVEHGIRARPRLLLYGITASDLNENRNEPHGPATLMTLADVATWWRLRPEYAWWCTRHWLYGTASRSWKLCEYQRGMHLWLASRFPGFAPDAAAEAARGLRKSAAIAAHDGYSPRPEMQTRRLDQLKAGGWTGWPFPFLRDYRLGDHQRYLEKIATWAKNENVHLLLVDMPVSADLDEHYYAPAFQEYRNALHDFSEKRAVPVIWATRREIGLTDADFADLIHLNKQGTERFTAWLRQEIEHFAADAHAGASYCPRMYPESFGGS